MKIFLLIISFCISICLSAQNDWYKNGEGFKSEFQRIKTGKFKGNVTGVFQLELKNNRKIISSFSADSAFLDIIQDRNNIYDVSFKNYKASNKDILVSYRTYGMANEIKLTFEKNDYYLGLIDGACDMVINGLEYDYFVTDDDSELLILYFSRDVGLSSTENYNSPDLFIKKGSTLIFRIKKN